MRRRLSWRERALTVVLAVLWVAGAAANTQESVRSRSDSATSVTVTGNTERTGWLGLSAYPVKTSGKAYHTVIFVPKGSWQERLALAGSFAGGTYEVALWEQKVLRSRCRTAGCKWCPVNGYHMDGLRSYSSGKVGR